MRLFSPVLYCTTDMTILGIESSCDETAAAVVRDGDTLLSNAVLSSMDLHTIYGGVVPEIAARSHIESIIPVIETALNDAFHEELADDPAFDPWSAIDGIAVTYGAGLGGSLLVGVTTARELAIIHDKPLYAINHVEGHVYASFLTQSKPSRALGDGSWDIAGKNYVLPDKQPTFPLLALIVSGGHSQLALFTDHFTYTLLGQTRDDAVGEAFDKVAKIIGLPYPGGPSIARAAPDGNDAKYTLPKAQLKDDSYGFSFSGLKTAVLRLAQREVGEDHTFASYKLPERLSLSCRNDIAASFQRVAIETLVDKTIAAVDEHAPQSVVIAGGVAASQELRRQLRAAMKTRGGDSLLHYPDIKLCTDNAAMIATIGCFTAIHNKPTADPYTLEPNPNLSM